MLSQTRLTGAEPDPEALVAEVSPLSHNHHWRIEEQGTASSSGTCRCGASRLFFNGWNDERDGWHGRLNARSGSAK